MANLITSGIPWLLGISVKPPSSFNSGFRNDLTSATLPSQVNLTPESLGGSHLEGA